VVGAGISGLLAARELAGAGWDVTVLDKGRGVGGRMATRRIQGRPNTGTFDHGAQFFTVRGERFGALVEGWQEAGIVEEWSRGFPDAAGQRNEDGHPRYRCAGGMTGLCKYLAEGLDKVRTGERVVEVTRRDGAWEVACEGGLEESAGALLITAPAPQALVLAQSGGYDLPAEVRGQLRRIAYDPCLALMALLSEGPEVVPEPGGVQIKGEPLDWISDNRRKGISAAPALTIHGGPKWSREHYDLPEEEVTDRLLLFASERLGHDLRGRLVETSLARWRYSWVTQAHPEPCLVAEADGPLVFAGDGFGSPKVEGAALSGLAAADRLLGREG
jgi:predicted NAD/FAD-dependent oxidoreductase